jgi:hypothetical protein
MVNSYRVELTQFGVLGFGLFQDRGAGVGFFPQGEEILIGTVGFGGSGGSGGAGGSGGTGAGPGSPGGPPLPPPTVCDAQLKYRPVLYTGKNHSFWFVQDENGTQYVIDAGPTGPYGTGFLNDWIVQGTTGHYPEDNEGAGTWYDSGWSCQVCGQVGRMLGAAFEYYFSVNNSIKYHGILGPNSNSFARWNGEEGWFYPSSPPDAQAWDTRMPVSF